MTKAELIAAIADAPDDSEIYIDTADGILRTLTHADVDVDEDEIILGFDAEPTC